MNKLSRRFSFLLFLALTFSAIFATDASAQATRTWVSGVGDDANPCSRTAPCKTFAGAISKTAASGEINCIDAGGFGGVTITKSITIDCHGVLGGVLVSGTNGIIVNAGASDSVSLRNLDINGLSSGISGIRVLNAAEVNIENLSIFGFQNGIDFLPLSNATLTINNITSRNNSGHGSYILPAPGLSVKVVVSNSRFNQNGLTGIRIDDGSATVSDSVMSGNGTHGVAAVSNGKLALERVIASGNTSAGVLSNGAGAVVWMSNFTAANNSFGLYPPLGGGQLISLGNNRSFNNPSGNGGPTSSAATF